ncbi:hypothetical protein, partial [uncultured Hydrogenophaga sp.]|uniref:hypothetical protein n=1 Tax=uncultured Hydrogenophaga sp. TaxID=199683 RepID=UPI00374A092F
ADLLSRIQPMSPQAWAAASQRLKLHERPAPAPTTPKTTTPTGHAPQGSTPAAFLRSVMNDPQAPLALRVEAARALLAAGLGDMV